LNKQGCLAQDSKDGTKKMKILIIGMGGEGSFLVKEIVECFDQEQMDPMVEITLADFDIVETKQCLPLGYQNFSLKEAGKNKAEALSKRYEDYCFNVLKTKIETAEQLKGTNLIILCVDNNKVRKLVYESGIDYIDLRSTGRRVFCMPKNCDEMKFLDDDMKSYSCQEQSDLDKGFVQKGHKIASLIGIQMLLNHLRGHDNKTINLMI